MEQGRYQHLWSAYWSLKFSVQSLHHPSCVKVRGYRKLGVLLSDLWIGPSQAHPKIKCPGQSPSCSVNTRPSAYRAFDRGRPAKCQAAGSITAHSSALPPWEWVGNPTAIRRLLPASLLLGTVFNYTRCTVTCTNV